MQRTVKYLHSKEIATQQQQFSVIIQSSDGLGTRIRVSSSGEEYDVVAHTSEIPYLEINDEVLAITNSTGAVITHKLRKKGERPQRGFSVDVDGALLLENEQDIVIKTNQASIKLQKDGRLFVDGYEIYAISDGLHRLQGTTIELN